MVSHESLDRRHPNLFSNDPEKVPAGYFDGEIPYYIIPLTAKKGSKEATGVVNQIGTLQDLINLVNGGDGPLIRIHSACMYSEQLGAADCDCRQQFEEAKKNIMEEKKGVIFYMHQEGRGAGLKTKAKAYEAAQNSNLDTVEAYEHLGEEPEQRDYTNVSKWLITHGITKVRLMTNSTHKIKFLENEGIVVKRVPMIFITPGNTSYLNTKRKKLGHLI